MKYLIVINNGIFKFWCAYRTRDEEAGEEIPDAVESGGDNGGDVVVRRLGHSHHTVEGESQKRSVHLGNTDLLILELVGLAP